MGPSFSAVFLVADVRGWGALVHALGPDPAPAADIIQRFWESAAPAIKRTDGEIYAWRGDGILAAYLGPGRMERALEAAGRLLAIVHADMAAVPGFVISVAITDGSAVAVPVHAGPQQSEELTGDWVNAAFDLVKWAAPGSVAVSSDVADWLARNNPASLAWFDWDDPREVPLAGAVRSVRQGIPAGG